MAATDPTEIGRREHPRCLGCGRTLGEHRAEVDLPDAEAACLLWQPHTAQEDTR